MILLSDCKLVDMKITTCVTILLLLFYQNIIGQTPEIDSLIALIEHTDVPEKKVKLMYDVADKLGYLDLEKSLDYAKEGLKIAGEYNFEGLEGSLNYFLAASYMLEAMAEEALPYSYQALAIAQRTESQGMEGDCHAILGAVYSYLENVDSAFFHYIRAREIASLRDDQKDLGAASNNIGTLFLNMNSYAQAIPYFKEAIGVFEKLDHTLYLVNAYTNLATATSYTDLDQAREYQEQAIRYARQMPQKPLKLAWTLFKMGELLRTKEEYSGAITYFKEAHTMNAEMNNESSAADNLFGMGKCYLSLDMLDSAAYFFEKAEPVLKKRGFLDNLKVFAFTKAQLFEKQKRYRDESKALKTVIALQDSIYSRKNAEALATAEAQLETEKKEAENAAQKLEIERQKNRNNQLVFGGILTLLLAGGIFLFFYNRSRLKKREAELALQSQQQEAERLRELDQLKSRFFTNISHELRTPLTLISGPLDTVLEKGIEQPEAASDIALARDNSQKLLDLVNEIMDLSKLESGKLELNKKPLPLHKTLKRIFFGFESFAKIKGVDLQFDCELDEKLWINTDAEKLEKIITNLVSNAIKFTDSGGEVHMAVKAGNTTNSAQIEVRDTGMGISAKDMPRIFDRFFQSTAKGAPLQGGTGIGLALSRELARLFGGDLNVKSEVDKGSVFTFYFPYESTAVQEEVASFSEIPEAEETPQSHIVYEPILINGEKPRLLIVEDNLEMREYLTGILKQDYRCTAVANGAEAMQKLQTQYFDLVTSDVMMPVMDGFELREKINTMDQRLKMLPFVFVTARALEEDKLQGLSLGVDDYITKPFSSNELLARIHNLLLNRKAREEQVIGTAQAPASSLDMSADDQLLRKAEAYVAQHIDNPELRVDGLAEALSQTPRNLSRMLRKLTGMTPVQFVLELRLLRARRLLELKTYTTVSEVQHAVGIESASYFSRKFQERFGKRPNEV